jgi:hypothetical protein
MMEAAAVKVTLLMRAARAAAVPEIACRKMATKMTTHDRSNSVGDATTCCDRMTLET